VKIFLSILLSVGFVCQGLAQVLPRNTGLSQDNDPQKRTPKEGDEVAVMETSLGKIVLMFFSDKAPNHVENFKTLAKQGFYDGTKFHRVIPGFMIQGGDPNSKTGDPSSWGMGGPEKRVKAEFNDVKHERGILSMARSSDPDSAGSQFFVMVKYAPSLDGKYSAFGKVVSGMETVDKIVNLQRNGNDRPDEPPVIKSVKIVKWPLK
jgi:peptidyl-prolyl cis-trans isomerase B (cyclophilin B)